MEEALQRITENLIGRVHGPLSFRFFLQPAMAIVYAVLDGLRDAREGKTPYNWALLSDPAHRRENLRTGVKSAGKIFVLAMVLDAVYQYIVLRWFYPVEAVLTATILAVVPYLVVRGPLTRIVRGRFKGK
jgi:hypothetical protein